MLFVMCTAEGCEDRPVAKGLCRKHYMRLRRTGDPNVVRKAGAKPKPMRQINAWGLRDASPRTLARLARACRLLDGQPEAVKVETLERATRSNGSVNTSKLLDMATMISIASSEVR
jgi:hypothetical protein